MSSLYSPLLRHNLQELLEGIEDFPLGLGEHLAVDGAAHVPF